MGGLGKNSAEVSISPSDCKSLYPMPLLIITGELDPYNSACVDANIYFRKNNFDTYLKIIPGTDYVYPIELEQERWNFLSK